MIESNGEGPDAISGVGTALWTLTLNRPDLRHAIDEAMQTAVLSAVRSAAVDPAVRAILLTGAGPALSAGGDFGLIRRMQDDPEVRRNVLDQSDRSLVRCAISTLSRGGRDSGVRTRPRCRENLTRHCRAQGGDRMARQVIRRRRSREREGESEGATVTCPLQVRATSSGCQPSVGRMRSARKVITASEKASLRSPAIMCAAPSTSTTVAAGICSSS